MCVFVCISKTNSNSTFVLYFFYGKSKFHSLQWLLGKHNQQLYIYKPPCIFIYIFVCARLLTPCIIIYIQTSMHTYSFPMFICLRLWFFFLHGLFHCNANTDCYINIYILGSWGQTKAFQNNIPAPHHFFWCAYI